MWNTAVIGTFRRSAIVRGGDDGQFLFSGRCNKVCQNGCCIGSLHRNICCRMVVSTATRIDHRCVQRFHCFTVELSWFSELPRVAGKDPHNAGQSAFGAKDDVMMCRTKDPYRFQKQVPKTGSKNRFHTQISAEQIIAVFFLVLQATCRLSRRCRDFRVPRCHSFW